MQTSAEYSADCCMLRWNDIFYWWVHWACPNLQLHSAHLW